MNGDELHTYDNNFAGPRTKIAAHRHMHVPVINDPRIHIVPHDTNIISSAESITKALLLNMNRDPP